MERGRIPWLVHDVQARAQLVFVCERIHEVEPATEINGQLFERLPLILQIETVEVAVLVVVIDDALRSNAGLIAIGIDRKDKRDRVNGRVLLGKNETGAKRVLVVELVTRIQLGPIREDVAIHSRGDPVKDQIADVVGTKQDRAEAIKYRRLEIKIARLFLISQNLVAVIFRLVLIQLRRIERRSSHVVKRRRLTRIIRNFEIAMVSADEQRHPAGFVDDVREIAEKLVLIGIVVDRAAAARGIFDADAIVQIIFRDVIAELPDDAAALEALPDRVETSDVD